jgi:hypothetical protein
MRLNMCLFWLERSIEWRPDCARGHQYAAYFSRAFQKGKNPGLNLFFRPATQSQSPEVRPPPIWPDHPPPLHHRSSWEQRKLQMRPHAPSQAKRQKQSRSAEISSSKGKSFTQRHCISICTNTISPWTSPQGVTTH